jgi:LacI family transcriptional regulator
MKHIKDSVSKKRNRTALVKQLRVELENMGAQQGAQLPSCRDWSRQLGASYSSIHRALCELQKEGFIEARSRSGWYMASQAGAARSVKSRKTIRSVRTREVVFPFLSDGDEDYIADRAENWSGTILSSISRSLGQKGMRLSLLNDSSTLESDKLPAKTIRLIESMPQPPAGVIMFAQPGLEAFRDWLRQRGIPNLTIGVPNDSTTTNFVSTNFREMGRVAGVAFGTCGFDRVVYLYGDFHQLPAERQRLEGLCSGFAETTGRLPTALGFGFAANSPREFGWHAMTDHLKRTNEPPQAVFAAGDYLAIGAIQALRDFGLRCPEQVVVVGTTGLDFAGLTRPSITTIDQPMQELGKQAANMLLQMSDQPDAVPGVILPSRMTFRESFPANDDLIATLRSEFKGLSISSGAPINQSFDIPTADREAPLPTL